MLSVTLQDIAAKAGVHRTTVSLALRNSPTLPQRTRRRIQALAEEMGYRPDPLLSALMEYRRRKMSRDPQPLAYLTHWDTRWGWKRPRAHADFFAGAESKARQLGYALEHFWMGQAKLTGKRMSDILYARSISGLLIASFLPENDGLEDFDWTRFSAVKIDYSPLRLHLDTVSNDQAGAVRMAVRRAAAAGYRRVGLVMPRWWDQFSGYAWSAGFLSEQLQQFSPDERIPILHFSEPPEFTNVTPKGRQETVPLESFQHWLQTQEPEVVISKESFVHGHFARLGLAVPKDIKFVDISLSADGATAGVHHNCRRVGEIAVDVLAGKLLRNARGLPEPPTCTLVEGTWSDGLSLPATASQQPLVS